MITIIILWIFIKGVTLIKNPKNPLKLCVNHLILISVTTLNEYSWIWWLWSLESSQKSKKIEKLSKQLTDSETQNENLKNSFYLDNKPLPALPVEENKLSTKQNIFKQLKTKAKVKFQKLQKLIKGKIFTTKKWSITIRINKIIVHYFKLFTFLE